MNQLRHQLGTYQMISAAGGGFCRGGGFSQPISQLRNGSTALQSGTRVPKGGFTAAKHPSKWGRGCEIKKISALALRSSSSNSHNFFVSNQNHAPFEALTEAKIMHTISCLKAWEVRSS